ncbi:SNF2-related protein [Streptacidiphilus sp. EB103A]|uniref:SNF2-related protein n=1 Tax=Streptacidiphilus sp. EB103A TaxID=3156275 RepID=UPI0035123996
MTSRPTPKTTGEFLKKRVQEQERRQLRHPDEAAMRRLDDREFSRLLSRACADSLFPEAFVAELTGRASTSRLRTLDLRALLLESAALPILGPARSAAWTVLATSPERATAVLTSQAQAVNAAFLLRPLPARSGLGGFGAQAAWRTTDGFVHGIAAYGDQRKVAQHRAAVSLLGHLSGVQAVVQEAPDGDQWEPVGEISAAAPGAALSSEGFRAQLQHLAGQPAVAPVLVAEVAARARAGVLDPRDLFLVLFDAAAPQWEPARLAILEAAASGSGTGPTLLNLHASGTGRPAPVYQDTVTTGGSVDPAQFQASVAYDPGTGPLHANSGAQRSKKNARRTAATMLLAQLAGLPVPATPDVTDALTPAAPLALGKNPVSALNEFAQIQLITDLAIDVSSEVSGKQPLFTCRVTCRHAGRDLDAVGTGLSKGAAREEAARGMLALVLDDGSSAPQVPVQAVGAIRPLAEGKDPFGALDSLKRTGVITDLDAAYSASGPAHRTAFHCVLTCRYRGQPVQVQGRALSKRASYQDAVRKLLAVIALVPAGPAPSEPARAALAPPVAFVPPARRAPADAAGPAGTCEAVRLLRTVLASGAAVTADLSGSTAHLLVFQPDGDPLPEPPQPLESASAELVLPGDGMAVRAVLVPVWRVPLRLLAAVLTHLDGDRVHASAHTWRTIVRLGLEAITEERVYPATDPVGADAWRLGPLSPGQRREVAQAADAMPAYAHCRAAARGPYRLWAPRIVVRQLLDALADAVVRGPGTAHVLGLRPYTVPVARPQSAAMVAWTDRLEGQVDREQPPGLVVTVKPPPANSPLDTELLWAVLRIRTTAPGREERLVDASVLLPDNGTDPVLLERVRRALRAGALVWPPLQRLLEQERPSRFTLRAAEAALLLGEMGHDVARAGVEIVWPEQWARALGVRTLIGARSPQTTADHGFGLDKVLDFRWQLTVDGENLSETEMNALAAAGGSLIRMRERWLLVTAATAARAADRDLGTLSASEALTAALTGSVSVHGELVSCEPVGALADLVEFLRVGSHQPVAVPAALQATLRDYQARGLAWLANTTRLGFGAVLADDMGTGKSITALALHLHRREQVDPPGRTLIVCPASMLATWDREIARFAPATPTRRYHGEARTLEDLADGTIVITTYGTLRRDADTLEGHAFDLLVADEAQMVKNHRTLTAQQLRRINARVRVALTGTPVENRLMDLWGVLDGTNPGLFGEARTFNERYARPIEQNPQGEEAPRLARMISPFMLRRRKSDPHILTELPPKITTHRYAALAPEQVALYEAVARETMQQIRGSKPGERRALVLTLLTQLRQICNTPAHYLRETPQPSDYDVAAARRRSGKIACFDDVLGQITEADESALVFTNYAAMGHLLVTHLRAQGIDPLFLHGQVPPGPARQDLVDAFQARRHPVMILTVKAGGTGLTLTEAGHVLMFDRPWNPAVETQAVDRAHRIGQSRSLEVHLLQTELTIEDRIDVLLAHKQALADAVLHSGETALADLSDTELADLIALGAR